MDSEDPVAKWKDWHIRLLRKDVGPRVDKMVQDRRDAERQLEWTDPNRRFSIHLATVARPKQAQPASPYSPPLPKMELLKFAWSS
jgi:hypothetical protein